MVGLAFPYMYLLLDPEYTSTFLLMHKSFTTSETLFDLLARKYDSLFPPYGLSQKSFEKFVASRIIPVRLKIASVLKIWIDRNANDFKANEGLLAKTKIFVETRIWFDFEQLAKRLLKSLETIYIPKNGAISRIVRRPGRSNSNSIIPLPNTVLPKLSAGYLHQIEAEELAKQLTIVDATAFRAIEPSKECLNPSNWTGRDKDTLAPNISCLVRRTNALTRWIATRILETEQANLNTRLSIVKYFIHVLQALNNLHNFHSVTSLVDALTMGPISRLIEHLWVPFKEKHPKLMEFLEEMKALVSPKGQYSDLRRALKSSVQPIVPFIGVYLTDLTFIEDGNPDFINVTDEKTQTIQLYINFEKRRKVASIIREIQMYQDVPYMLTRDAELCDGALTPEALEAESVKEERVLYSMSVKIEPRQE